MHAYGFLSLCGWGSLRCAAMATFPTTHAPVLLPLFECGLGMLTHLQQATVEVMGCVSKVMLLRLCYKKAVLPLSQPLLLGKLLQCSDCSVVEM